MLILDIEREPKDDRISVSRGEVTSDMQFNSLTEILSMQQIFRQCLQSPNKKMIVIFS